mmetsp:Transcript_3553/g.8876  ORF Transcript_3553/g.8876 Transcript_3553/m.8876 type:complete len:197 (-) Transcript_3553:112-702(-)
MSNSPVASPMLPHLAADATRDAKAENPPSICGPHSLPRLLRVGSDRLQKLLHECDCIMGRYDAAELAIVAVYTMDRLHCQVESQRGSVMDHDTAQALRSMQGVAAHVAQEVQEVVRSSNQGDSESEASLPISHIKRSGRSRQRAAKWRATVRCRTPSPEGVAILPIIPEEMRRYGGKVRSQCMEVESLPPWRSHPK